MIGRCSERLARMRLEREAEDSDATFSPAVNDRSLRIGAGQADPRAARRSARIPAPQRSTRTARTHPWCAPHTPMLASL